MSTDGVENKPNLDDAHSIFTFRLISSKWLYIGICWIMIVGSLYGWFWYSWPFAEPKRCSRSRTTESNSEISYTVLQDASFLHLKYSLLELQSNQTQGKPSLLFLFIHGHVGGPLQAALIARQIFSTQNFTRVLSFNFKEEPTGLDANAILEQAVYVNQCVKGAKSKWPEASVILIGHSMGGLVSGVVPNLPDYECGSVSAIISIATPWKRPLVPIDAAMVNLYSWMSKSLADLQLKMPLAPKYISLITGQRDLQVDSNLSILPHTSTNFHNIFFSSIPGCWANPDHISSLNCKSNIEGINQIISEYTRDPNGFGLKRSWLFPDGESNQESINIQPSQVFLESSSKFYNITGAILRNAEEIRSKNYLAFAPSSFVREDDRVLIVTNLKLGLQINILKANLAKGDNTSNLKIENVVPMQIREIKWMSYEEQDSIVIIEVNNPNDQAKKRQSYILCEASLGGFSSIEDTHKNIKNVTIRRLLEAQLFPHGHPFFPQTYFSRNPAAITPFIYASPIELGTTSFFGVRDYFLLLGRLDIPMDPRRPIHQYEFSGLGRHVESVYRIDLSDYSGIPIFVRAKCAGLRGAEYKTYTNQHKIDLRMHACTHGIHLYILALVDKSINPRSFALRMTLNLQLSLVEIFKSYWPIFLVTVLAVLVFCSLLISSNSKTYFEDSTIFSEILFAQSANDSALLAQRLLTECCFNWKIALVGSFSSLFFGGSYIGGFVAILATAVPILLFNTFSLLRRMTLLMRAECALLFKENSEQKNRKIIQIVFSLIIAIFCSSNFSRPCSILFGFLWNLLLNSQAEVDMLCLTTLLLISIALDLPILLTSNWKQFFGWNLPHHTIIASKRSIIINDLLIDRILAFPFALLASGIYPKLVRNYQAKNSIKSLAAVLFVIIMIYATKAFYIIPRIFGVGFLVNYIISAVIY